MARINGTNASQGLGGTPGNDAIFGYGGNDSIWGGTGHDLLNGGTGADYLHGGHGEDSAVYWNAASGVTVDFVEPWKNTGEAYGDKYIEIENIHGSTGYGDKLSGNGANNKIYGHGGNDEMFGGGGNDLLDGGDGHDYLRGGSGNDTLNGGNGDDVIVGGIGGTDVVTGGAGSDVFVFSANHTIVTDFQDGVDRLRGTALSGSSFETFGSFTVEDTVNGVMITHNWRDQSMLLLNIDSSQINHGDFFTEWTF